MRTGTSEFYKLDFTMTKEPFRLRLQQYLFVKNANAFVTFTAEQEKFDRYKIIAQKILDSFAASE